MRFRRVDAIPRPALAIGFAGTAAIHAGLIAVAILGLARTTAWQPTVYAVELVAAPPPAPAAKAARPLAHRHLRRGHALQRAKLHIWGRNFRKYFGHYQCG